MKKPSDQWKKLRRASLERAYRKLARPLEPVFLLLIICGSVYLSGFTSLFLGGQLQAFNWITGLAVSAVAIAGLLLPFILTSAITLLFVTRSLKSLVEE